MKVGDQLVVSMEGFEVTSAVIEDITDGEATILIPATRIVMGVKQSLTELETDAPQREWTQLAETGDGTPSEAERIQQREAEAQRASARTEAPVEGGESIRNQSLDSSVLDD